MTRVQIRNVPDELVARLKARAAAHHMSLSGYLRDRLQEWEAEPTLDEVLDGLTSRPRRDLGVAASDLLTATRAE